MTLIAVLLCAAGWTPADQDEPPPPSPAEVQPTPSAAQESPSNGSPSPSATPDSTGRPTPRTPTSRVRGGFSRYLPDSDGEIEWELKGDSARFLSLTEIEITRVKMKALDPRLEGLTINVDIVIFNTKTKVARSDEGRVTVRRGNSVLTGKGLLWTPDWKELRIFEDVKVLINEENNRGFFPL